MHRDCETGLTIRELAERFGVDRETVELSFDRYRLPKRVARSRRADCREQHRLRALEMQRLYEGGLTIAEVADHFGVDRNTVDRSFAATTCQNVPPDHSRRGGSRGIRASNDAGRNVPAHEPRFGTTAAGP